MRLEATGPEGARRRASTVGGRPTYTPGADDERELPLSAHVRALFRFQEVVRSLA